MNYFCNPMNLEYRYQFFKLCPEQGNQCEIHREAADPSLVLFKGTYYLFPSMTAGFFTSQTMEEWEYHRFSEKMPIYDYAPDVRVIGDYLYFSASKADENCAFYRTKDPLRDSFEQIEGSFPFWDPNLFQGDDGKLYFYWGCSNIEPIYGVELNPDTMQPVGEKIAVICEGEGHVGFERVGEDHVPPRTEEEVEKTVQGMLQQMPEGTKPDEQLIKQLYGWFGNSPYLEGAWMTKHQGRYYLQYATPGTEYNVYADGVYVADAPLGPFRLAKNNPYSYKPGGFMTGAGHGSTMEDKNGRLWHTSTMRISIHHGFERRVGLWKAGFDEDGELYCDQRYGDWPMRLDAKPWEMPEWMLLSYGKAVNVSTGKGAENITDENARTWWKAESSGIDEWAEVDLGEVMDVRAVQINFADDLEIVPDPEVEFYFDRQNYRAIDLGERRTRWILEGSQDGVHYFVLADKSGVETDLSHDFLVWEDGRQMRFIRISAMQLPFEQPPCISGIRAFGKGQGSLPMQTENVRVELIGEKPKDAVDMLVSWKDAKAVGYNILWGYSPDKLYHSYLVFGKTEQKIGALVKGEPVYLRVDAFNENGITEGTAQRVR